MALNEEKSVDNVNKGVVGRGFLTPLLFEDLPIFHTPFFQILFYPTPLLLFLLPCFFD